MLTKSFNFFAALTLAAKLKTQRDSEDLKLSCGYYKGDGCCGGYDNFCGFTGRDVCEVYDSFDLIIGGEESHTVDKTIYLPNVFRWIVIGAGAGCKFDITYVPEDTDSSEVDLFTGLEVLDDDYVMYQVELSPLNGYLSEWEVIEKNYCDSTFYIRDSTLIFDDIFTVEEDANLDLIPLTQPGTLQFSISSDSEDTCTDIEFFQF